MYRLKALVRFLLFWVFRPFAQRGEYEHESVTVNYLGWYRLPVAGCVAFIQADGKLQFYW
jgi:hypothetical protein